MNKHPLVCDTTLLLYLDRIGQMRLLRALFEPVCVPELVRLELDMGRLLRPDTLDPSRLGWISLVSVDQIGLDTLPPNRLGRGERAVIAYAQSQRGYWVGLDDRQARTELSQLLLRITMGEEVVIAQAGKPVARLVPFAAKPMRRVAGSAQGQVRMAPDFDAPLPDKFLGALEA